MLKTIHFGTCCVPEGVSWMTEFLAAFGNFPSWLIVANFALGAVNRDLYFLLASNIHLFVMAYFLALLSSIGRVRHPSGFEYKHCHATAYAFPDPVFVTSLSFFLTAVFPFFFDARLKKYMTQFTATIVIVLIFGYCASTLISGYFDVFLLAVNIILALVITTLYVLAYGFFVRNFRLMTSHSSRKVFYALGGLTGKDCEVLNNRCRKPA
jgi:hypothetical protein